MSSWEDIANEIAPLEAPVRGLATGARRGPSRPNVQAREGNSSASESEELHVIGCPIHRADEDLHRALQGQEYQHPRYGAHYRIARPASHYDAAFQDLPARLEAVLQARKMLALEGADLRDLLFVDIETTGLSSSEPLFLIGALNFEPEPQLELFLARSLDEEAGVLAAFGERARHKTIVTFNGKSFDWPYIQGRTLRHRLRPVPVRAHLDLLHHARRAWKSRVPNCRLQTLERFLCGRARRDDVPSSQIPREYEKFAQVHAQTGRGAHLMAPILHHNALDVLTMAELLALTAS